MATNSTDWSASSPNTTNWGIPSTTIGTQTTYNTHVTYDSHLFYDGLYTYTTPNSDWSTPTSTNWLSIFIALGSVLLLMIPGRVF